MKPFLKSKLFGCILSDGSVIFLNLPGYSSKMSLYSKSLDPSNHRLWTGLSGKKQTEISVFVDRLTNKSKFK